MAVRLLTNGEKARAPSILNRPMVDVLTQSGYTGDGLDFAGFEKKGTNQAAGIQWGPRATVGGFAGRNYIYYGGVALVGGVPTAIANGSVVVTDNAVSYIERTYAGLVSANIVGFTPGRIPMAKVTALANAIIAIEDWRPSFGPEPYYPTQVAELGVTDTRYPVGNPRRYGAVGDKVADDTAAWQAAMTAVGTLQVLGGVMEADPGSYKITAPLIPPGRNAFLDSSKLTIRMNGARLYSYDAVAGRPLFKLSSFINTEGLVSIEGGTLDGANATATTVGVEIHCGNVRLARTVIRSFGSWGVDFVNDLAAPPICCEIDSCYIQRNKIGVRATVPASTLYIHGGRIEHNNEENIYLDNCGKICFVGVTVENPGDAVPGKNNIYIRNAVDGLIDGCYFECNPGVQTNVAIEGVTSAVFALTITGNRFVNLGGIGLDIGSTAGAVEGIVAHGNYYAAQASGCRLGTNARGCSVGPDYFSDNFDSNSPAWSAVTNYIPADHVKVGGINYMAIVANVNQTPPNATYWSPVNRYMIVNAAQPNKVYDINRYAAAIYGGSSVYQALKAVSLALSGASAQAPGKLYLDPTIGAVMQGFTGTGFDWSLLTPGAGAVIQNPTGTPDLLAAGHYKLGVLGKSLYVKEGVNGRSGVAVLAGGTVTIPNTTITGNTRVIYSRTTAGGGALGHLSTTQINGTSFTINSSSAAETSTINWELIEAM